MKKTYRNALRSRAMIRQAFVELLAEKPLNRITVVDIVSRADLSRNTFYAHYQDVYAILEEFGAEMMHELDEALDETVARKEFDDPVFFWHRVAEHIDEQKTVYKALFAAGLSSVFITQLKERLVGRISGLLDEAGVHDKQGFFILMEVLSGGFTHLLDRYLQDELDVSSEQIVMEISRIYRVAAAMYK